MWILSSTNTQENSGDKQLKGMGGMHAGLHRRCCKEKRLRKKKRLGVAAKGD